MSLEYKCDICKEVIDAYQESNLDLSKPNGERFKVKHVCPRHHYLVEQAILNLITTCEE